MTSQRPPFPEVIDDTLMRTIKECEGKAWLMYVNHWKPKGESVHLHAGAAWARGLEVARKEFWDNERSAEDAIPLGAMALMESYGDFVPPEEGSGSAKTLERMLSAFEYYFDEFPLDRGTGPLADGRPIRTEIGHCVEFSFAEPLDLPHPETGEPLIYSGRTDMIAHWAGGIYIWDDKTASQLGASWGQQWDLRSQFTGYVWAARRAGFKVDGVIANGLAILKTKFNRDRAITNRSAWEVDRWYTQTLRVLRRFIDSWRAGEFEWNLADSCSSYGGCAFRPICKSPPETRPEWLPMYFERRLWDPLRRIEVPLEDES